MFPVGIIGCGLIGEKRARSLPAFFKLSMLADPNLERLETLSRVFKNVSTTTDWEKVVSNKDIQVVVIATPNHCLAKITQAALENGKHVLVEKPAAIASCELKPIIEISKQKNLVVHVGFNHRFHPAFLETKKIMETQELGPIMYIRGRYGHGGRLHYNKEWRADKKIAGGGELIDQGIHLIDLSRYFLGDILHVKGSVHRYFWDMPVEDNAFFEMQTPYQQTAWMHVSCTEWKNLFSFEIFAQKGKIQIDGLGGSYGTERLTLYRMLPEMGPPETISWEYPGEDRSFMRENEYFLSEIEKSIPRNQSLLDAYEALKIVEQVYAQNSLSNRSQW